MNYITIENKLHEILLRACHYSDLKEAERAVDPLAWYVGTDRAPLGFLRALCNANSRQVTTIAKRLLKLAGGDYSAIIASVAAYLQK
mgnify:CR=1 FL=1